MVAVVDRAVQAESAVVTEAAAGGISAARPLNHGVNQPMNPSVWTHAQENPTRHTVTTLANGNVPSVTPAITQVATPNHLVLELHSQVLFSSLTHRY